MAVSSSVTEGTREASLITLPPMFAESMPPDFDPAATPVAAEPKLDGHRHLVRVRPDGGVEAWSSREKDAGHKMDPELTLQISRWMPGIYDGELHLGYGHTSSDVALLRNRSKLIYTAFDVLAVGDEAVTDLAWENRRTLLMAAVKDGSRCGVTMVRECRDQDVLRKLVCREWNKGGEGLMLKLKGAPYAPGCRREFFLKVKAVAHAVLTVTRYDPPATATEFGTVHLIGSDGVATSVKVLNHFERAFCIKQGNEGLLGRKLQIEYQMRTSSRSYRHPVWDGWR